MGAQNTSRAPTEKEFVLRNRSLVRASFQIANVESDHDPVFFFSPLSGVVAPESTLTIKVRYTPLSAGTFTCDNFDVLTPGGNTVRLTCKGRAVGPSVSIWKRNNESNFVATKSVNFQDVQVGKPSSRVITLRNESPIEVCFHFSCQQRGVFLFDQVNGKIAPFLDLNVTITFTPVQPGNFYRRFFLLIHNQSTRFVDVLGTAYDDKTRPSPFQQAHVDAYHLRVRAGLGLLSPDQLETYWQDNGDELFLQGALRRIKQQDAALESLRKSRELDRSAGFASPTSRAAGSSQTTPSPTVLHSSSQILTRSGEASIAEVEVCHEYFVSVEDKSNAIAVYGALLDFGNCGIVQFPSKKTLQVTNNTHGKVTCSWRVSTAIDTSDNSPTDAKVFQVFPESADIAAGGTAEFRVAFQPSMVNSYYFAELEGFVSFKSNRTFRLVNVETFAPPWCLISSVCGNTFASPTEQFLSKLSFKLAKRKVHFPSCFLGDHVFQTVLMENASDTPALFAFVSDPSETFACKPASGYIGAKSFHLVQIRFSPRKPKKYTHVLQCVVNNARSRPETVELIGICALPSLVVEDETTKDHHSSSSGDAKLFIKPTSMGLQSVRSITIANASRVPLVFKWEIPRKHQDVFRVAPKLGRLNGNERVSIECAFSPQEVREYISRFVVVVKPISIPSGAGHPQHLRKAVAATMEPQTKIPVLQECTVKVQTKGTVGAILFDPETLQFETVLVNTSARQSLYIVNVADCDLQFALHQRVQVESERESVVIGDAAGKLSFSETQGRIAAHSRKKITATFLPSIAGKFAFEVSCAITTGDERQGQEQERLSAYGRWGDSVQEDLTRKMCVITAEASFPTVVIQDIRVPRLSSQLAWRQFQCRELNEYLSSPLSKEEELANSNAKGGAQSEHQESGSDAAAGGLRHFAIPFSPAALGSETQQVFLKLKNPGLLVVQFRLRYPKEGNVEIEHWAETGAPSSEEVRLNAIIDSKVFGISPRKATLLPRQSILLAISYAYTSNTYGGMHDLPIFLEVDKGKRVMLELQGRTLGRHEPKLFVPQRVFHLSPVMLSEFRRLALPEDDNDENEDRHRVSQARRPPVQQIEVFNCGESAFRLEVGSNAFSKVNTDNHGFPVLHCATTSEIVPARSSVFVEIEFNPIEAKRIEAILILNAHGLMGKGYKEAVMLTVVATGYHPRQQSLAQVRDAMNMSAAEPPRRQLLAVPDQPACFVSDFVDFSHMPMYSQVNQLVILQNEMKDSSSSASKILTFEWDATHPLVANGVLQFAPKSGELTPGEKAMIRVSLQALGDTLVVNHDVACFITYRAIQSSTGGSSSPTKASGSRGPESSNLAELSKPRASVINRSTATQEAAGDKAAKTTAAKVTGGTQQSTVSLSGTSTATSLLLLQKPGSKDSHKKSVGSATESKLQQSSNNSKSSRRNDDSTGETSDPRAIPLFVRVYAHILPQSIFEKSYSHEQVKRMPIPLLTTQSARHVSVAPTPASRGEASKSSSSITTAATTSRFGHNPSTPHTPLTTSSPRGRATISSSGHPNTISSSSSAASLTESRTGAEKALCRDVLYGVMEALVVDAMNSSVVQEALELQMQPLSPPKRAIVHARGPTNSGAKSQNQLYPRARRSDDCQAILASIMDNTVLNILQELFHGDLEQELLCMPRKAVFPTSPKSKQLLKI